MAEPGAAIGMHMRNYVPDRSVDWVGGVALPEVELHYDDGRVLKGEEACAATMAPLRGKQVPLAVNPKAWQAMTRLPWMDRETAPARAFDVEPLEMFFNREYLLLKHFFSPLALDSLAVQKGGFWSNLATRYGYKFLNQQYGKVYVVHGKMPSTPKTWSGEAEVSGWQGRHALLVALHDRRCADRHDCRLRLRRSRSSDAGQTRQFQCRCHARAGSTVQRD